MTRTIYMRVMPVLGIVFNVGNRNGDSALLFLRSLINLIEGNKICEPLLRQNFRDRCGKSRFAMVNVTNGSNVYMRFISDKFFFSHAGSLRLYFQIIFV